MFSFRTTSLEEQLDKTLHEGKIGCFCTQNCWDTEKGRYMYDIFRERGNLQVIFNPRDTELTPLTNHIEFTREEIEGLGGIVVEIQDVGARYFNYTKDVFRLMDLLKAMKDDAPSLYIVDHNNPAGRIVEGSMPSSVQEANVPKVAHRHGLTLGELANLYYHEIAAKFPLHIISALATGSNHQLMVKKKRKSTRKLPKALLPNLFSIIMYKDGTDSCRQQFSAKAVPSLSMFPTDGEKNGYNRKRFLRS